MNKGDGFKRFLLKYWNGKFRCIGTLRRAEGGTVRLLLKQGIAEPGNQGIGENYSENPNWLGFKKYQNYS